MKWISGAMPPGIQSIGPLLSKQSNQAHLIITDAPDSLFTASS